MAARTWRGNTYRFTVTAATAAAGDTYTNNGQTFTVTDAIAAGTVLYCFGTGAPSASGNLVRTSGAGTNPIVFSAVTTPDTNWGTTTNWLENAVPLVADDVTFNANSRDCTVNTSARVCKSIDFTLYANTITMTFDITVSGNITLGAGMTIAGAGNLALNATCTLTSNSKTWPNTLSLGGGVIFNATFADNWRVGSLVVPVSNGAVFLGNTIYVNGDVNLYLQGIGTTTDIVLDGTGDQTLTSSIVSVTPIESSITINKPSGKITFGATVTWRPKSGKTFKYITAGSYSTTGSTFYIYGSGTSGGVLDISGINLNNIRFNDSGTTINMTLASNVNVDGSLTSLSNGINLTGAYKILVKGDCLQTNGVFGNSGTFAGIELTGSNNQTLMLGGGGGSFPLATNLIINKSGGVVTLGSTSTSTLFFGSSTATLTFTNGTIDPRSTTFSTIAGTTYNINNSSGFSLNNWSPAVGTHTINTNTLVVNSSLTLAGATTFAGTTGWTCGNLICTTAGTFNITLQQAVTYRTRSAVSITGGTSALRPTITSSTSNLAIWTLDPGATQTLIYVNGTNIDSSLGQTVWTFGGIISATTKNWNVGTRPGTSAYTFVN
jgi:hypothetical protein